MHRTGRGRISSALHRSPVLGGMGQPRLRAGTSRDLPADSSALPPARVSPHRVFRAQRYPPKSAQRPRPPPRPRGPVAPTRQPQQSLTLHKRYQRQRPRRQRHRKCARRRLSSCLRGAQPSASMGRQQRPPRWYARLSLCQHGQRRQPQAYLGQAYHSQANPCCRCSLTHRAR